MNWFRKILNYVLPEDPNPGCGYGPFRLPDDHPFVRDCLLHDYDFGQANQEGDKSEKSLDEANWDFFYRAALITAAEPDLKKRLKLADDLTLCWRAIRFASPFLWDGRIK